MASSDSVAFLPVFVDTSLDTHLATAASPHDTLATLKGKLAAQHLVSFPAFGSIHIQALVRRMRGTAFQLSDSLSVGAISDGIKGPCFLEALVVCEVQVPNTDAECGIPLKQKRKAKKGKFKRVKRTHVENRVWEENFDVKRARKKVKVPDSHGSVTVGETESVNMGGENLRHDSESPEISVDPSSVSADSTLTPLEPVDSMPVVRPEGSMCSKCASVFLELKKVKIKESFLNKELSDKLGIITKLRKMIKEAENREKGFTNQVISLKSALRLSEERAREAEARMADTDLRANKAEAECTEADAMAHNAKMQLLEADVRAQKSEVKACKFELKLKEAEVWAQKANAELAKAEKRAHKLEKKLMEALERARSAEAKVTEVDVKLTESQRGVLDRRIEGGEATLQAVALRRIKEEHY